MRTPKGQPVYSVIVTKLFGESDTTISTTTSLREATRHFIRLCDELRYESFYGQDEEIILYTSGMDHDFRIELIRQYVINVMNPALPPRYSNPIL